MELVVWGWDHARSNLRNQESTARKRVSSIFSQILQSFSRLEFDAVVKKHQGERHAHGFECWTQFVAMLFCQLGNARSLSEITGGLAACEGKLVRLAVKPPPKESTPAYAMPTNTGPGRSTGTCSRNSTGDAPTRPCIAPNASSGFGISC